MVTIRSGFRAYSVEASKFLPIIAPIYSDNPNWLGERNVNACRMRPGGQWSGGRWKLGVCLALLVMGWPVRGYSQSYGAAVTVGANPSGAVVNPVTNKIYVTNGGSNTVSVVDGGTLGAMTVTVGQQPTAVAVDPVTNKIYVVNACGSDSTCSSAGSVTVIDGATNSATTSLPVGMSPGGVAVNPATNEIYVTNTGSNTVTVISGDTATVTATVTVGAAPQAVALDLVTNKIYVANYVDGSVSVIDGSTNSAATIVTVPVGTQPSGVAVNLITNEIYVANAGSNSVSVINGATNNIAATVNVGGGPKAVALDPVTNQIYVGNTITGSVSVINGVTDAAATVPVAVNPSAIAVNPSTNQVYVLCEGSTEITVINGASGSSNAAVAVTLSTGADAVAVVVNPVTNEAYVANYGDGTVTVIDGADNRSIDVAAGAQPSFVAVDAATNQVYVANSRDGTVSVIDGVSNSSATVPVGTDPIAIAINPVTNKAYVVNYGDNTVTIMDGATSTVGAHVSATLTVGTNPQAVAVDPATNLVYVATCGADPSCSSNGTVVVIDGTTDNIVATVEIGANPASLAVNTVTDQIYVTNIGSNTVTVIDGTTNDIVATVTVLDPESVAVDMLTNEIYVGTSSGTVTVINGVTDGVSTIEQEGAVRAVAVNPLTNQIYATNPYDVMINCGTTNSVCNALSIEGTQSLAVDQATNRVYLTIPNSSEVLIFDGDNSGSSITLPTGTNPQSIAVNPVTSKVYIANQGSDDVTVISEDNVQSIPLTTSIVPIPAGETTGAMPTFTFTVSSTFLPTAPAVENVYFQLDTLGGPWIAATAGQGNFVGTVPLTLALGTHIVYAYATDGQDAGSAGPDQTLIGQIAAEVFTVAVQSTVTALSVNDNPAFLGQSVTFTADVDSSTVGTPTGTVTFFDGMTALGPGTVSSGEATLVTTSLGLGSHSITAVYNGDANYAGSSSGVLTEVIEPGNPSPALTSLSQTSANAGSAAVTLQITGSNLVNGSIAEWNGSALTTTYGSATTLTATIPTGDLATPGVSSVTLFNPAPGGGTSNGRMFTVVDYTVSSATGPQTVEAGASANFVISTAPVGGAFAGAVTFSATELPTGALASFSPPSVVPGASTTMTVTTTARTASVVLRQFGAHWLVFPISASQSLISLALATLLVGMRLRGSRRIWGRRFFPLAALILLILTASYLVGCGAGASPSTGNASGTPAGTYPITVTGISGTDVHSTTVMLTVH
jgi:YVTN family beta-propeller protein